MTVTVTVTNAEPLPVADGAAMRPCPLCGNDGDGAKEDPTAALYVGMYGPRYGQAGCNRCGLSVTARVAGEGREARQAAIDEAVRRWNWMIRGSAYPLPYVVPSNPGAT